MAKIFILKYTINNLINIEVQTPPDESLIDTYVNHIYNEVPHLTVVVVDDSTLPDLFWQSTFVDVDEEGNISIDINLAKEFFMTLLRQRRNRKLIDLDVQYVTAYHQGDEKEMEKIEKQKQVLRTLSDTIDLSKAKTLADLEALWPTDLLGNMKDI